MTSIFMILALVFAVLTLVAIGVGVVSIGKSEEFREKYANRLMQARVVCQALSILFLILAFGAQI